MHIELSARIVAILNLINRMWAQVLFMSRRVGFGVDKVKGNSWLELINIVILYLKVLVIDFQWDIFVE